MNSTIICGSKIQLPDCIDDVESDLEYRKAVELLFDAAALPIPVEKISDIFVYHGSNMQELYRLWVAKAYDLPVLVVISNIKTNPPKAKKDKISPYCIEIPSYMMGFTLSTDKVSAQAILDSGDYVPVSVFEKKYHLESTRWEDLTKLILARQHGILFPVTIISAND